MATYKNYLYDSSGTALPGVQVCLYDKNNNKLDVDVTNEDGYYFFSNLSTGRYEVRFFGNSLEEDSWFEIYVVDDIITTDFEELIFVTNPTLTVTELNSKISKQGEISTGFFEATDLNTSSGKISSISLYSRQINEPWSLINSFNVDFDNEVADTDITTITGVFDIELQNKPSTYFFKLEFYNEIGELGNYSAETSSIFYGVNELEEYVGVADLIVQNAVTISGQGYYTVPSDELICSWTDMKFFNFSKQLYNALGQPVTLSQEQLKTIQSYSIFMFISKNGENSIYPWPYPTESGTGTWYYNSESYANKAKVRIPINRFIRIWVGFKTEKTSDTSVITTEQKKY